MVRHFAMNQLGNGLFFTGQHEDALSVREAELSTMRRVGDSQDNILASQSNLAMTYHEFGRLDESMRLRHDVYSGTLKLYGEEHKYTFLEANNYANMLASVERYEKAKSLLRRQIPVARRVLGEGCETTLRMRYNYARALYIDPAATLDDLSEAVTTFEDMGRLARRVFGGSHPLTKKIDGDLRQARAALRAGRETPGDA